MGEISNFKHRPGVVCITTILRDLIEFTTGQKYDEDFIFGLSSGIFFAYTSVEKWTGVIGVAGELLMDNFCGNVSAKICHEETETDDWEDIKSIINSNMPLFLEAAVYNEMDKSLSNPTGMTMSEANKVMADQLGLPMDQHQVLIHGYDEKEDLIMICDNRLNMEIPRRELWKCRPERKKFSYLLCPEKFDNIEEKIYRSIRCTCDYWHRMPEHPKTLANRYTSHGPTCGPMKLDYVYNTIHGIEAFRNKFLRINCQEDIQAAEWTIFAFREYSYRSSAGDFARGMYARFLGQSYSITHDDRIKKAAGMYRDLSKEWRSFFKWFIHEREGTLEKIMHGGAGSGLYANIDRIADKEIEAINYLETIR